MSVGPEFPLAPLDAPEVVLTCRGVTGVRQRYEDGTLFELTVHRGTTLRTLQEALRRAAEHVPGLDDAVVGAHNPEDLNPRFADLPIAFSYWLPKGGA